MFQHLIYFSHSPLNIMNIPHQMKYCITLTPKVHSRESHKININVSENVKRNGVIECGRQVPEEINELCYDHFF